MAEVVVDPDHRGGGIGTRLGRGGAGRGRRRRPGLGPRRPARGRKPSRRKLGLKPARELLQMRRPLDRRSYLNSLCPRASRCAPTSARETTRDPAGEHRRVRLASRAGRVDRARRRRAPAAELVRPRRPVPRRRPRPAPCSASTGPRCTPALTDANRRSARCTSWASTRARRAADSAACSPWPVSTTSRTRARRGVAVHRGRQHRRGTHLRPPRLHRGTTWMSPTPQLTPKGRCELRQEPDMPEHRVHLPFTLARPFVNRGTSFQRWATCVAPRRPCLLA